MPALYPISILDRAASLARSGGLGNSDAIALVLSGAPPEALEQVLLQWHECMSPQALSKLIQGAFVPLPAGARNQRFEPLFDRHPLSGRTYTTRDGVVVPDEIQYYDGQMVHLYGECTAVDAVAGELAGSGYRPLTFTHPDGRRTAAVQVWANNLRDTSLRPYDSMFIVVMAVPEAASGSESSLTVASAGAASVLPMLRGNIDGASGRYHNAAGLYFVRLYDSTRLAVDLGRERMGTDKRPGQVGVHRNGAMVSLDMRDGARRKFLDAHLPLDADASDVRAHLSRAAALAGMTAPLPTRGTEQVFPALARIGTGPLHQWNWHTDVTPELHWVKPGAVRLDPASEEGRLLMHWGFTPSVFGYIPNVRGVITGLQRVPAAESDFVTWARQRHRRLPEVGRTAPVLAR